MRLLLGPKSTRSEKLSKVWLKGKWRHIIGRVSEINNNLNLKKTCFRCLFYPHLECFYGLFSGIFSLDIGFFDFSDFLQQPKTAPKQSVSHDCLVQQRPPLLHSRSFAPASMCVDYEDDDDLDSTQFFSPGAVSSQISAHHQHQHSFIHNSNNKDL